MSVLAELKKSLLQITAVVGVLLLLALPHCCDAWMAPPDRVGLRASGGAGGLRSRGGGGAGSLSQLPPRKHNWVEARKVLSPDIDYKGMEKALEASDSTTGAFLHKFGCPSQGYIQNMYIDTKSQDAMIAKVKCANGYHWFRYSGMVSGHVTLDNVYNSNPIFRMNKIRSRGDYHSNQIRAFVL